MFIDINKLVPNTLFCRSLSLGFEVEYRQIFQNKPGLRLCYLHNLDYGCEKNDVQLSSIKKGDML